MDVPDALVSYIARVPHRQTKSGIWNGQHWCYGRNVWNREHRRDFGDGRDRIDRINVWNGEHRRDIGDGRDRIDRLNDRQLSLN